MTELMWFAIGFVATLVIWFLQSFDARLNFVTDSSRSLLAAVGKFLAPLFRPLGFDDWRVTTALVTGFTAKEAVVSTLGILLGTEDLAAGLPALFSTGSAVCFLAFTLLYTPCVAAIAAIGRELGGKWRGALVAVFQCVVAWIVAALLYQVICLLAWGKAMNWLDILLVALTGAWLIGSVIFLCRRKKSGCCGCCAECAKQCADSKK